MKFDLPLRDRGESGAGRAAAPKFFCAPAPIKYYDFIPFFDFQYEKIIFNCQPSHFSLCSAVPATIRNTFGLCYARLHIFVGQPIHSQYGRDSSIQRCFFMKITVLFSTPLGNTTVFSVDGNGLVTTLTALDFESVKSYLLVVTVADGGSPQFSTDTTVSIQVTGTNEFTPVFSNSTYSVSHSEVSRSVHSINQSVSQPFSQ